MQQTYDADGKAVAPGLSGYVLIGLQIITTTGSSTYTPTPGTRAILVHAISGGGAGGGGAGGASNASAGAGGGGGAFSLKWITSVAASYSVSVGAAGTNGGAGNTTGGNGGDTTFDTTIVVAKGGTGGAGGGAGGTVALFVVGGAGGAASGGAGDVLFDGNAGGASFVFSATVGSSGQGAAGPWGGAPVPVITNAAGTTAFQYGAGGSGGCVLSNATGRAGGNGFQGVLIIEEYG